MKDFNGLTQEEFKKVLAAQIRHASKLLLANLIHTIPYDQLVSVQNAPYNFTKYLWIIKEDGLEYKATFKRIMMGNKTLGYRMTKEIL